MTFTNRLAGEKSPYLLQHAHNPVDWRPWGEEVFAAAREADKPVFLSVGYSTCHWCHVMERESFEDEEVAALLNAHFVPVKVDREERPDIDSVYMTVCQMLTGRGGWPLTIVMTPEGRPFFAGTYFAKHSGFGRAGLMELLPKVSQVWRERRDEVVASADKLTQALHDMEAPAHEDRIDQDVLSRAAAELGARFDAVHGGFGPAPKFPTPHNLLFLLRCHSRFGNGKALEMVTTTLSAMRRGGLFDHVGFGFHRYSTDRKWLLPHFEKMLYDQALLVMAYAEAYQATGEEAFARVADEVITYVLRDLTAPEGGFLSAEDADSEGVEGKFYVWEKAEVAALLGPDAAVYCAAMGIEERGNYLEEATREETGLNIPHLPAPLPAVAAGLRLEPDELAEVLERCRVKLFDAREKRARPSLDDKILTDWNGLMIAALAVAAKATGEARYLEPANRAADFVLRAMTRDGRLLHRYRAGEAAIPGMLADYAYLMWGLVELSEASLDPGRIVAALALADTLLARFHDPEHGGFYQTADDAEKLLVRQKDFFDGALPAGNSVAALALLKLSRLTGRADLAEVASGTVRAVAATVRHQPAAFAMLLAAVDFGLGPSVEIVIAGEAGSEDVRALHAAALARYLPRRTLLFRAEGDARVLDVAPFTRDMGMREGKAAAYVCRDFACEEPVASPEDLARRLSEKG